MAFENIVVEITDHVGLIRLDRPNQKNALNEALRSELAVALDQLDRNEDVRCLVLTGSESIFSAGADIKEMKDHDFVEMFRQDRFAPEARAFEQLRKPIIAAVAGHALGGGCELAMMCDIIIAAENACFGQPEINIGIMAGLGGTQRLTRAVGKSKSMEMHLTGRRMGAEEAASSGLVSRVVPLKDLMKETMELADKITEQSPLAVIAVKEAVNSAQEMSLRDGLLFERRLFHALFSTEDKNEGMDAFVDRREPRFRGC
ncbi:MAG: enoyl-CoA hydratase-related protein [Rhodobacteraceae bacterium]|nr:enoyl-CoA hydratase-related protein [Paracoccaceae bacterium]MCY4196039.1 enoyl-CoA hydratase-related protein [Paracoccaceae bacterium]